MDSERIKKKLTVSEEEFEENWGQIFKREKVNTEKNRYKRKQDKHKRV